MSSSTRRGTGSTEGAGTVEGAGSGPAGGVTGPHVLTREECLSLLASVPVGRLVFSESALPAVVPVNFVLSGRHIVLRTGSTTSLAAAVRGSVVAFEADRIDEAGHRGWSVTVVGRAEHVTDPDWVARLEQLPLLSWAGDETEQFVVIAVELVNGRRVGVGPVGRTSGPGAGLAALPTGLTA